jgi:hypothetical protein
MNFHDFHDFRNFRDFRDFRDFRNLHSLQYAYLTIISLMMLFIFGYSISGHMDGLFYYFMVCIMDSIYLLYMITRFYSTEPLDTPKDITQINENLSEDLMGI